MLVTLSWIPEVFVLVVGAASVKRSRKSFVMYLIMSEGSAFVLSASASVAIRPVVRDT